MLNDNENKGLNDNFSQEDNRADQGTILGVPIQHEMKKSYINYAMSVIVARALPDVRDGLKPVQRRILYAMYKENIMPEGKFFKSMGVVGEVLKKYHPHGDASVYDALARLVQDWVMRYPLIIGQGNFGTVDGDAPAAPRYTECKLSRISLSFLEDLEKNVVDFVPNYTGEDKEPTVLPARLPNLLLNGADGIAVGMATKIPPHNLGELVDGIVYMIQKGNKALNNNFYYAKCAAQSYQEAVEYKIEEKNITYPEFTSDVTVEELMRFIKGPDFPTGGSIYDIKDLKEAYETGRGRVIMRGVATIEESEKGKTQIVITELPYQVNKAKLAERIYELYKDGKIEGIFDIRDESNLKEGIRLVVELRKGISPTVVLNKLYKYSELQMAFNFNMVAIVNNEPRTLSLREALEQFIKFQYEILIRSSIFDLNENIQKEHKLEGLKIALDFIDEVISIIRASKNSEVAKDQLMRRFGFSDVQAQTILDMQLRRLAALERKKIEEEYNNVKSEIDKLRKLLDSQEIMERTIINGLLELKEKYKDTRKTKIYAVLPQDTSEKDLVQHEDVIILISKKGYVKRMKISDFRLQARGGKGSSGISSKEGDFIDILLYCDTHSEIFLFSNMGKVYSLQAYQVPEMNKKSKGLPLINLINIEKDEVITTALVRDPNKSITYDSDIAEEGELSDVFVKDLKYLLMCTRKGMIKKINIHKLIPLKKNRIRCVSLQENDELAFVRMSDGSQDVMIMTKRARAIRFNEASVRVSGRSSRGVRAIKLNNDDCVIMMDVVRKFEDRVIVISEKGYAKMTALEEFPTKKRGGKGVLSYKITAKTGPVSTARIIDHPHKELIVISSKGLIIRMNLDDIKLAGRNTSGVIIFRVDKDDKVMTCALI